MRYLLAIVTAIGLITATACESATNSNMQNANTNIRPTATPTQTATPRRDNSNITREEYDRDRSEYERDRGSSTIGQGINDSWLWFKTKTALAIANDLRDSTINVDVVNDRITLKGTVATAEQKTLAGQIANGIEGQKGVDNLLLVRAGDSVTNQVVNGNTASNRRY